LKRSAWVVPDLPAGVVELGGDAVAERPALGAVVVGLDVHRGAELADVALERVGLGVGEAGDVDVEVGLVGFEQQQGVGRWWARPWSAKKWGSRAATTESTVRKPAARWSGCRR
jgi:hypothetical protein